MHAKHAKGIELTVPLILIMRKARGLPNNLLPTSFNALNPLIISGFSVLKEVGSGFEPL
jgi:hypothetical protein